MRQIATHPQRTASEDDVYWKTCFTDNAKRMIRKQSPDARKLYIAAQQVPKVQCADGKLTARPASTAIIIAGQKSNNEGALLKLAKN